MMSPALDPEEVRSRLLAERDELRAFAASSREARKPIPLDQQSVGRLSRMSAIEQQVMLHAVRVWPSASGVPHPSRRFPHG